MNEQRSDRQHGNLYEGEPYPPLWMRREPATRSFWQRLKRRRQTRLRRSRDKLR